MDAKFAKLVQENGWSIQSVTDASIVAKCPSAGCNLFAELKYGDHVPAIDPGCIRDPLDVKVPTWDDIRRLLRDQREKLLLTIREVEEIAGIEGDLLAKVERDGSKKVPNVQTLSDWAGALGFEIVLRPIPLTSYAIRTIIETRAKTDARTKRMSLENRRRSTRNAGGR